MSQFGRCVWSPHGPGASVSPRCSLSFAVFGRVSTGSKENGWDKPPWIVAHSTHVSYPTRHFYMQVVCQTARDSPIRQELRDATTSLGYSHCSESHPTARTRTSPTACRNLPCAPSSHVRVVSCACLLSSRSL